MRPVAGFIRRPSLECEEVMPRIVPSRIVAFMEDRGFTAEMPGERFRISGKTLGLLRGLVVLIDAIPDELMPSTPHIFAELIAARETLRTAAEHEGDPRYLF